MTVFRNGIMLLFLIGTHLSFAQSDGFDSFISRLSDQYKVDVAIAPELIPALDSIRNIGAEIKSVEELLHRLLNHTGITYQIMDGNKLMLRREHPSDKNQMVAVLQGTILDSNTHEPLPYATVFAPTVNAACNTDEQGLFILPVSDTSGNLQINYLGYKPVTMPLHNFMTGNAFVKMEIQKVPLEQVIVVVPYRLMAEDHSGQSTDLKGYQFISEDQLLTWNTERLITSLTTYTHFSSEEGIRIRGSDAGNSLFLMDEIPVYDPYHFYNIFSPFNGQYFSSVQIYKNNLPIEYGGRIDGMIYLQSKREKPRSKLILDTDLLLSSVTTELAISPNIYLTAGGRISHTGILKEALSDSSVTNFSVPGKFKDNNEWSTSQQPSSEFYDVNIGLSIQPVKNSTIRFSFFDSKDHLDNTTQTDFQTSGFNHEITSIQQTYTSKDEWKNMGFAADIETVLSEKTNIQLTAFHSMFNKDVSYTSQFVEKRHGMNMINNNSGFQQSDLTTSGIKAFIQHQTGLHTSFTLGAEFQNHQVDFVAKENITPYLSQAQKETEVSLFGEYKSRLWNAIDWTLGSRMTYLQSTSRFYPLPDAMLNYSINEHYSVRTSYSRNLQAVHALTVEDRFGRELDYLVLSQKEGGYPVLKSDKYMVGVGYTSTCLSMDIEGYYKKMDGLASVRPLRPDPSFGDHSPPGDFYRLFTGDGWTSGVDVTLLYKKKKTELSLLYTLSKLAERYDMLYNGDYYSPQEDRRHQVKATGSYRFGKFQASALLTYKSKAPYLSLVRLDGRDGIGMVNPNAVQRFLPPYFSLDLGLDFSFKLFKQPSLIGVSLINATNHENISGLQHLGKVHNEGGGDVYLTNQTELLGRKANVHFRYLIH